MTTTGPTARKRDRDEVFLEYTKSICPVCKVVLDGQVNVRGGKVFLRKRCRTHGEFEALVYGDAQMYLDSTRFNKPGTIPLQFQTQVRDGCPSDCGLCPDHKQHACLGLIEVNTAAIWTARSASQTPVTTGTGTRSPRSSARQCWTFSSPPKANRRW